MWHSETLSFLVSPGVFFAPIPHPPVGIPDWGVLIEGVRGVWQTRPKGGRSEKEKKGQTTIT